MKLVSCYVIPLSTVAIALSTSVQAQETIVIPDVSVETQTIHIPRIRVQTHAVKLPKLAILQAQAATADTATLAKTLQEYTAAQVYNSYSGQYSPEMSKKTREIALLRRMLDLKLTARDIERALPLLRELRDVGKEVPAKPDQALDEEIQRLLRARPGDPLPPSSAEALRDAATGFRNRRLAIWEKMTQAIGKEKTNGIRSMLRSEPLSVFSSTTGFRNMIGSPAWTVPAAPGVRPAVPRGRAVPAPKPDAPPADAQAEPAKPGDAAQPASPAEVPAPDTPRARRQGDASRTIIRGQRGATGNNGATVFGPGGVLALGQGGNGASTVYTFYTQASLEELISLFERHLAAMK